MELSITVIIIIVTTLISIGGFSNQKIIDDLIFYPPAVTHRKQWWRFFTCGLIHADFGHLIFNMLSLYFFGKVVEDVFQIFFPESGKWLYLVMYVSALFVSIIPTYSKNKNNYAYRSLGASGAVSAVVFAGLIIAPDQSIYLYFIPIPIPGFIFAPLYLLISFLLEKRGGDNINHSAHIWGSIYGFAFIVIAGRIAGYDLITLFVSAVKNYLRSKGWM
ncbi:MAG: rhomboid family intramembrane serine protease [Flavisolibacter sp.]